MTRVMGWLRRTSWVWFVVCAFFGCFLWSGSLGDSAGVTAIVWLLRDAAISLWRIKEASDERYLAGLEQRSVELARDRLEQERYLAQELRNRDEATMQGYDDLALWIHAHPSKSDKTKVLRKPRKPEVPVTRMGLLTMGIEPAVSPGELIQEAMDRLEKP